ncbi:hypothetical protein [Dyella psychrodurans]|uniref:Uncharacterized protein n=1 Tax=Dyella psychrodurans TaxID=1927960 RepID=A0A370XC50_9GAMM|nr:hypothetical protein [Dyella psychrodurans]RDS85857.1 hypothetical protein DWU99_00865 [Dyella psychrodurans]
MTPRILLDPRLIRYVHGWATPPKAEPPWRDATPAERIALLAPASIARFRLACDTGVTDTACAQMPYVGPALWDEIRRAEPERRARSMGWLRALSAEEKRRLVEAWHTLRDAAHQARADEVLAQRHERRAAIARARALGWTPPQRA